MTYVAKMFYLDDGIEKTIKGSQDEDLNHILELAQYKVHRDEEYDAVAVRHDNEWLLSHRVHSGLRSYVMWIEEM